MKDPRTKTELVDETARLRQQLEEAEATLTAIRNGEVDALVVRGPEGERLYSLTTAERVYRLIVESMNEAALTVSTEGTILFCNQFLCDLLRTPMPQVVGRRIADFAAQPQRAPLSELLEKAQAQPVQERLTLRAADGTAVPVQIAANRLESEAGVSVCLVMSDLTELETSARWVRNLREQQEALQASEARYRALVEVAPDAIVVLRDNRFVFANPAALALYGVAAQEDLLVLEFPALAHHHDSARLGHLGESTSVPQMREFRLRRLDGREVPIELVAVTVEWQGRPAVQVIMRDITERKRIEQELKNDAEHMAMQAEEMRAQNRRLEEAQIEVNQSRARYYDLYEMAPSGFLTTDERGTIRDANLRADRLLGAPRGGLLSRAITDFIAPEGQDAYYLWRRRLIETGSVERPCELPMRTGEGDPLWIRLEANVDRDRRAGIVIRHTLIDITERRRAEEALAEQVRTRAILAATGTRLLDARAPAEVFALVADQLLRLTPGAIAMASEYLPESNQLIVRSLNGPEGQLARAEAILRRSPVGLTFTPDPGKPLKEGLVRLKDLRELTFGQLPPELCRDLEAALRFGGAYAIPFVIEDELLGTVSLLTTSAEPLRNEQSIEALATQATLALRRLRVEQRLRESRERFRVFAEAMPQMVWSTDAQGATEYFNRRALEYGGESSAGDWTSMLHPDDRPLTLEAWQEALDGGGSFSIEHRLRRKDGQYRWHLSRGMPLRDEGGGIRHWVGTSTDVHGQRLERERLTLRNAVTQTLGSSDALGDAAPEILRCFGEIFDWDTAELWLCDPERGRVVPSVCWLKPGAGLEQHEEWFRTASFLRGEGVPGRIWANGEPVWIADVAEAHRLPRTNLAEKLGLKSLFAFPIRLGREVLGVAVLMAREARDRDPDFIQTADTIGSQIGQFIQRQRAEAEVQRLNQDLQRRVSELEAFFATVPIGLSIAEDPEARHVRGNTAIERMLRAPAGGDIGPGAPAPPGFRVFAEGRELSYDELPISRAARGERVMGQKVEIERSDGVRITGLSFAAPIPDASGRPRGAVAAFLDITELQAAEEARRLSEERYRALFEAMSEAFALHEIICDDQGRPVDYRFLEVNPAFERMTGLRVADVIGRTVREVLPGVEPTWIERYGQVTLTGKPDSFESFAGELGRWYGVHAFRAAPGQFAVVFVDITERKLAEEEFQQAVAEHAYDRLFAILREFQHGEGLAMNLHRIALFAQNVDLLAAQPAGELAAAEAAEGPGGGGAPDVAEDKAAPSGRCRLEAAAREYRTVGHQALLSLAALLRSVEREFDSGPGEGLTGAEVKALAESLSAGLDELMQAIGTGGALEGEGEASAVVVQVGERLAGQVEILQRKLADAMRQLRTHYTADLCQVAETIAQSFGEASPPVEIQKESTEVQALISSVDLSDLLRLLISNSLDALGGVGADAGPAREKAVRLRIREDESGAVIEVEDTGPGVPPALRARLFQKGFSTKGPGRGSGLSFALEHLGKYGGKLVYDESYKGGARFRVTLVRV